ncbi:MAG: hypothetical protein A3F95_00385 [Candidatus Nealsonbacteria bacterium RIFCSPLOWO2_12_FULL_39_31]|uniref:Uncharacterized protein n=2 Tax=Candidatus Nealsoniibacteriota TaxID=1817911 RepID=A0A1G2EKS1_9BACT|nr:MAG: hypothetical protein A2626_01525 [Candidatus Nealsonbacteria bacterium RIFCSPHIGHO2_01_FULL_38_55]OGZ21784.1 MAG: hypothetical protein A3C48_01005 [Candidatus Nealsonbacteria bacterium RIFCSPHIGHO2_02_FULL_38_75]OGZ21977.1 MAG: hypothetical protein A2W55_02710 [Candidatus Nealsonbacteria bacterium RIFCSPHIGHO2_02_38_10]OGZ23632.1 MAG: hypothetical protein A2981_03035 [Candidatus Nealsonbacteria bacterium RIFCSPLOWO2_01_FULL_38_120]OGZ25597.1 MAG: hypothetical protein A3I85_02495 [Candid
MSGAPANAGTNSVGVQSEGAAEGGCGGGIPLRPSRSPPAGGASVSFKEGSRIFKQRAQRNKFFLWKNLNAAGTFKFCRGKIYYVPPRHKYVLCLYSTGFER